MIQTFSLEANIVRHCTNRCVACSHASPFSQPYLMTLSSLHRDLSILASVLHVQEFYLLGGEPLLHPAIALFIEMVKGTHIADKVGVTTNGRLLSKMEEKFWQQLDFLKLSIYTNLDPSMVELAESKSQQYGFRLDKCEFGYFFKQFKLSVDGESFKNCKFKNGLCYTVHEGRFYLCPQSAFFTDTFMGLPQDIDGLNLLTLDGYDLEKELTDYMHRETPFAACRICSGQDELTTPWREIHDRAEWIKESTL